MMFVAVAVNARDARLIPTCISLFTWAKAYHVELVFSDGTAIIADPSGVRMDSNPSYDFYKWAFVPLPNITHTDEISIRQEAENIARHQSKYDYLGALFGWLGSSRKNNDKWYCSELVAHLLEPYFPQFGEYSWITPQQLWKVVSNKVCNEYKEIADLWKLNIPSSR